MNFCGCYWGSPRAPISLLEPTVPKPILESTALAVAPPLSSGTGGLSVVFCPFADTVGEFPLAPDGREPGRDGLPRGEESWGSGPPRRIRRQYRLLREGQFDSLPSGALGL